MNSLWLELGREPRTLSSVRTKVQRPITFYDWMIIAQALAEEMPLALAIEVDESYFGGRRKGKRGRGAAGKVPVLGILKRGGRV